MPKAGKRGPQLAGTCERCLNHSKRLVTVLYFVHSTYETTRELRCYCPGCRKGTNSSWRWPESTSQDAKIEKSIQAQEAFNR